MSDYTANDKKVTKYKMREKGLCDAKIGPLRALLVAYPSPPTTQSPGPDRAVNSNSEAVRERPSP